ncbi:MAG: glycosyltransferase [Opitutaceae bacterium]|jgi:glycosyltransferase involved in cell wall biosynthesis|nr:glycosyltransferase [Opitutaceae bacterium]
MPILLTVILCTRDPHPARLARTLEGLAGQTLASASWELLLIDNGSSPALHPRSLPSPGPALANLRVVPEPVPGLTPARLRGIAEARGDVLVFVDDDNVLASGYLAFAASAFASSPRLAAAGGPVRAEFETIPPAWTTEFHGLLALHDHGSVPLFASGGPGAPWPSFAPVGAGLCLRRAAGLDYAARVRADPARAALDRRAGQLTSGGDNDIVFTALRAGGDVAYLPELALTHLIPTGRVQPDYLVRLNRAIQRSWVRVLALHEACPWRPIPRWTLPLRFARAWLRACPWRGPAERVRCAGLIGRLEGQADLTA